ncbi:hypothetical protein GCM10027596_35780 [Nocardioides korecus]
MSAAIEAKTAMRQLSAEAQALVTNKSLTSTQKSARLDQIESEMKAHQETVEFSTKAARFGSGASSTDSGEGGSYATLKGVMPGLVASGYEPMSTPQVELSTFDAKELHEAAVSHKNLAITKAATDSSSIGPATITDYKTTPVTQRREPTRVMSLMPIVATPHPSVTWYSTTGTTAAAAVAEGGLKPTSTLAYVAQTSSVTKIAHVVEVTDETLQDFPAFMSVLSQDMTAGLVKAENAEFLTATVTGAHKFPGLLNTTGILTAAVPATPNATDRLDSISAAFDSLRTGSSFAEPDGIVLHPADWGTIRRSKDTQNRYLLGDPGSGTDPRIWGVPVVLTTQITQGTCLIGDFAGSTVAYVRDGIRIETANQGTTQFTTNTCLVRVEERVLLTVPRPSGLLKLTGL